MLESVNCRDTNRLSVYDVQDVGMLSEATIDKQLDSIVEEVDGLDTSVDTFETLFCFVLIALFLRAILN